MKLTNSTKIDMIGFWKHHKLLAESGKILELTLTGGKSLITGNAIGPQADRSALETLQNLKPLFYENLSFFAEKMAESANGASVALSHLRVPFLSCFMGGLETAVDCRDPKEQGTKYHGSGCLIHGLSVVSDSFVAVELAEKVSYVVKNLKNYLGNPFRPDWSSPSSCSMAALPPILV